MPRRLLLVKLRRMGLLQRKEKRGNKGKKAGKKSTGGGGRRRGEGAGGRVDVALLRRLYEEHKAHPDHLNTIAALLPGGKTVKQVGPRELPCVGAGQRRAVVRALGLG